MNLEKRFACSTLARRLAIEGFTSIVVTNPYRTKRKLIDSRLLALANDRNPDKLIRAQAKALLGVIHRAIRSKQEPLPPINLRSLRVVRDETNRLILFIVSEHEYSLYLPRHSGLAPHHYKSL